MTADSVITVPNNVVLSGSLGGSLGAVGTLPIEVKRDLEFGVNAFFFCGARYATVYKKGSISDEDFEEQIRDMKEHRIF